jgi:hypothetical protein
MNTLQRTCFDLVVVEATPGGIAMAVRAAREDLTVLLVNRTPHLGGMLSSGLGVWDTRYEGLRAPIYDEVRQAIFDHYRRTYGKDSLPYRQALPSAAGHGNGTFEPQVAERALTKLVAREKRITVLTGTVPIDVNRSGTRLESVTFYNLDTKQRARITAAIFADCTYEGDLAALARVPFRLGRESRAEYNELHAGVIYVEAADHPPTPRIANLAEAHERLNLRRFPGFQRVLPGVSTGNGDDRIQGYNYRIILSSDPNNQIPVADPERFDPAVLCELEYAQRVEPLPNQKISWNRPLLLEDLRSYIEGDRAARQAIMDRHWDTSLALLYFIQNDPSIPKEHRDYWRQFGLACDEFTDNEHRPYEIYVREARRINGRYTIIEHDVRPSAAYDRAPIHRDSVTAIEWYLDAHASTRRRVERSLEEGKMMLYAESFPGQVPYRALLPQGLDNLLVPVCLSATHVAWGAIRLEPTWMSIGEAAGFAAAQAVRTGQVPAEIDTNLLMHTLAKRGVLLSFFNDANIGNGETWVPAAQYFGALGFFPNYEVRPGAPLTRAVAALWVEGLAQLLAGTLDPDTLAAALHIAEESDTLPVTCEELAQMLPSAKHNATRAGLEIPTRADALAKLWEQLPTP